jgi:hypothetical protein
VIERDDFEERIREGLQRREPPPGFADRVMQRVAREPRMPRNRFAGIGQWAVAAALLLVIGGGVLEQRHRAQQIAGEQAREQVMEALQITSTQLQRINGRVNGQQ